MLDTAASSDTSVFAPLVLAADGGDVYFFQNGDLVAGGTQNNTGTLMRVQVKAGATPSKIADKVSTVDLQVFDNAVVFLQNLATPPVTGLQFGDAAMAEARRHRRHRARHEGAGGRPAGGQRGARYVVRDVPDRAHRRLGEQHANRRLDGRVRRADLG